MGFSRNRTLENGKWERWVLSSFLNSSATPAQRKRVIDLLDKLKRLEAAYGDVRKDMPALEAEGDENLDVYGYLIYRYGVKELQAEVNAALARYPLTHVVSGTVDQDEGPPLLIEQENAKD